MTTITDTWFSTIKAPSIKRAFGSTGSLTASSIAFSNSKTIKEYLDLVACAVTVWPAGSGADYEYDWVDDAIIINTALLYSATNGNGAVHLLGGTAICNTSIAMTKPLNTTCQHLKLFGNWKYRTIIKRKNWANTNQLIWAIADWSGEVVSTWIEIFDLALDGNGANQTLNSYVHCLQANCFKDSYIHDIRIYNNYVGTPSGTAYGMGLNTYSADWSIFERIEISNCDKNYWITTRNPLDEHKIIVRDCTWDSSRAENFYHEAGTKCTFDNITLTNSWTSGFYATQFSSTDSVQTKIHNMRIDTCKRGVVAIGSDNYYEITVYNDSNTANESVQINGKRNDYNIVLANQQGHWVRIYGSHNDWYVNSYNCGKWTNNAYSCVLLDWATYCNVSGNFTSDYSNKPAYGINEVNGANYNILGDAIGEGMATSTVHATWANTIVSPNVI